MSRDLRPFGAFFTVEAPDGCGGWRPLRTLLDDQTLDERVAAVRASLAASTGGDIALRVAASTLSLGLFARLVSPVLGAAALGLRLPRPGLDDTWWRPADRGPWPLALTGPGAEPAPAGVITEVVTPIAEHVGHRYGLSPLILRGNAASAVFGAVAVIRAVRVDLFPVVRRIAAALLAGPLAGAGDLRTAPGPGSQPVERFVRSSCCLYYRVPGGGYCGDCLLAVSRAPTAGSSWRSRRSPPSAR